MPISANQKIAYLEKAIEITKAAAGSGCAGCVSDELLKKVMKTTYDQMVSIADSISP